MGALLHSLDVSSVVAMVAACVLCATARPFLLTTCSCYLEYPQIPTDWKGETKCIALQGAVFAMCVQVGMGMNTMLWKMIPLVGPQCLA